METKNKPETDLEYTSAQKLFEEQKFDSWKPEEAPILVGIGIRNPENIGGLIRLAGTIGCSKVIFADDGSEHKTSKIKKTATTGFKSVNWCFSNLNEWKKLIPKSYTIIALETTKDAEIIYNTKMSNKTVIVVGDESYGIDIQNLKLCHKQAYIPMIGPVKSLNVTHAASIALFEIVRQNIKFK